MRCTEIIDRYCEVWSETDRGRREDLLSSVLAIDATYTDPTVSALDSESLLAHIERSLVVVLRTVEGGLIVTKTNPEQVGDTTG